MSWSEIGQAVLLAFLPWVAWVTWSLRLVRKDTQQLVFMHEHPEETGFGTVGHVEATNGLSRAIRELIDLTRWNIQETTGKVPPPYMEKP